MRMLKKIAVVCMLAVVATACHKEVPASLSMLNSVLMVDAAGGTQDISFKTNQSWSVRSDAGWVTVAPSSGAASDSYQIVNVTVAEEDNYLALATTPIVVSISDKNAQTITADDVTATYGDTDKSVSATRAQIATIIMRYQTEAAK